MAGFEKTAKTPRAGRFPPPHRGPRRRSRLDLLTALDGAQRPSPPRPQRGPRRRRRPSPPSVPRPTPVPPRLGVFNRRPPTWFCGTNQETRLPSALAPSIQEWTPQLPLGQSSGPSCPSPPSTARSMATAPPRQLSVDTRRPCTCNQRPSTRSHRTVDNSLITTRSEYSTFLNLPLDECIVNTPQTNQKRTEREAKTEKNKEDEELEQVTKARKNQEQVT